MGFTIYLYIHSELKELDNVVGYGEENDENDEESASDKLVTLSDSGVSLYSYGHHRIYRTCTNYRNMKTINYP